MAQLNKILWLLLLGCATAAADTIIPGPISRTIASGGGGGSPAFVDHTNATPSASASSLTITTSVASGNMLVVGCSWEDADRTPTVSSDLDGSFTALTKTNSNAQIYGQTFYKDGLTAGTHVITISYGSTTSFVKASAYELSDITSLDAFVYNADITGNASTGTTNTANAVEVLLTWTMNYDGSTGTEQAGWTEDYDITAFHAQHFTTSSSGSYRGTNTLSASSIWIQFFHAWK